jgi:hypothetical protein
MCPGICFPFFICFTLSPLLFPYLPLLIHCLCLSYEAILLHRHSVS